MLWVVSGWVSPSSTMPNTDSRLIDAWVATVRPTKTKNLNFLPEEGSFDELAPSGNYQGHHGGDRPSRCQNFVKKLIEKKAVIMWRCLTWLRKCSKKTEEDYQRVKKKDLAFKLDPLSVLFFSRRALISWRTSSSVGQRRCFSTISFLRSFENFSLS